MLRTHTRLDIGIINWFVSHGLSESKVRDKDTSTLLPKKQCNTSALILHLIKQLGKTRYSAILELARYELALPCNLL